MKTQHKRHHKHHLRDTKNEIVLVLDDSDAHELIQKSMDTIPNGGTIFLEAGTWVLNEAIQIIDRNNITIESLSEENPATIQMSPDASKGWQGSAVFLQNSHKVTIKGIDFDGNSLARGGPDGDTPLIYVDWSNDLTIDSCWLEDALGDAVFLWGGFACTMPPCDRFLLSNSYVGNPGRNGVSAVNARFYRIVDTEFENINNDDPSSALDAEPNQPDPVDCNMDAVVDGCKFTNVFRVVFMQNIGITNPAGFVFANNKINGGKYGVESQWAAGQVFNNEFTDVTVYPIVTGSYPAGGNTRIWGNKYVNCPANALQPVDVVND